MRYAYKESLLPPQSKLTAALFSSWQHGYRQICLSGNRGCGKTVALVLYVLSLCRRVPGLRVVWARSEYATIRTTIIDTLQYQIFKHPLGDSRYRHPRNPFRLTGGVEMPRMLIFSNGSSIRFIGLDDKSKTRGTEADLFVLNEGTREETMEAWSEAGATMAGGRGGGWYVNGERFSQIVTDTNPSSPQHWIYQLFRSENPDDNDIGMYAFDDRLWLGYGHIDNPLHTDDGVTLNALGQEKVNDLLRVYPPGYNRERMVHSQWVAAAGMVYPFDERDHVGSYERSDFPDDEWDFCRAVDYGWNDPNVCDLWALRKDGKRAVLFKEIYQTELRIDEFGKKINEMCHDNEVDDVIWTVTDHRPDYNDELNQMGIPCVNADKSVLRNINLVREAFGNDRLRFNRQMLAHDRDIRLMSKSLPCSALEEIVQYRYPDPEMQVSISKVDVPLESCADHSMNALEYFAQKVWGTAVRPRLSSRILH